MIANKYSISCRGIKLLFSFGYLLLTLSCRNNLPVSEILNSTVQTLSPDSINIKASEIGTSVRYVSLKASSNINLIGDNPERIIVSANKIFLLDQQISNSLYVFDTSGVLLYKVSSSTINGLLPGKRNKEYQLTDFALDEHTNSLLLFIAARGAVLYFDAHSGRYKRFVNLNPYLIFNKFNLSNEGNFIFSNTYTNSSSSAKSIHLCQYDSSGNYKGGWLHDPLSGLVKRFSGLCLTSTSANFTELLFARFGGDTIYALKGDSLITRYKVAFSNVSNRATFQTHLTQHNSSVDQDPLISENTGIYTKIHSTNKYIYFEILTPTGILMPCLFNKDTKKGGEITYIENDFSSFPIPRFPSYINDFVYAGFISGTSVNNLNKLHAEQPGVGKNKTLFPGHDPVIVLLYLKK